MAIILSLVFFRLIFPSMVSSVSACSSCTVIDDCGLSASLLKVRHQNWTHGISMRGLIRTSQPHRSAPWTYHHLFCLPKWATKIFCLFFKCSERSRRVSWAQLVALGSHSVRHVPQDSLHFIPGTWTRSAVGFEKGRCQSIVRVLQCLCNFN